MSYKMKVDTGSKDQKAVDKLHRDKMPAGMKTNKLAKLVKSKRTPYK